MLTMFLAYLVLHGVIDNAEPSWSDGQVHAAVAVCLTVACLLVAVPTYQRARR